MSQDLHDRAMELFDEARLLELRGAPEAAREKYEAAAEIEERAAAAVAADEPRTRGILRVGAVSLWMQAGKLDRGEALARRYLSEELAPGFHRELHELLNDIRRRRAEMRDIPVEPDERAADLADALRKAEANLGDGKVWLRPIRSKARAA
jgi:hypothetical protein